MRKQSSVDKGGERDREVWRRDRERTTIARVRKKWRRERVG
jgi:hypothetical protein